MTIINHGLIEGQRDDDYIAGTLPYEERNPSGDWTPYLPLGEKQFSINADTQACVTFSALNSVEAQYKFLTGQVRNFSDRFTAKMSGTSREGNWLWKVADSIRRDGLADDVVWPAPINFTWDSYYATPSIEVVDSARAFLDEWCINYEWVELTVDAMTKALKQAPLQVTIPGHAVLNFNRIADVQKYFDSYEPFKKDRTIPFLSALKIVLSKKKMFELMKIAESNDVWLVRNGQRSLVYNADALLLISDFANIKLVTKEVLEAIQDTNKVLAAVNQ